jgi:hypothetical protein
VCLEARVNFKNIDFRTEADFACYCNYLPNQSYKMPETLEALEKRIQDTLEYYCTYKVSTREAAWLYDLTGRKTLLYLLYNTTARPKTNWGLNKLLSPV